MGDFGITKSGGSGGGVESVTGLNTDNTDSTNPIVQISVDGTTITGAGTPASPLVGVVDGVESVTGLNTDNTDSTNPIVQISVDGTTITGAGTPASPLVGVGGTNTNVIMFFNTNGSNLANADDYFITVGTSMGATENSSTKMPIPAGTLTAYSIVTYVGGSFASNEASSVSFVWADGASEELLSNAVLFDARNNKITGTKSVAVTESYGWIRLDTATFSSNPSATKILILLTFEV